jgi:hypothetical protein
MTHQFMYPKVTPVKGQLTTGKPPAPGAAPSPRSR